MKIGLITIYGVPNYGSVLQAFATQKIIEQLGHECVIIKYDYYREQERNKKRTVKGIIRDFLLEYWPTLKTSKLRRFRNQNYRFTKELKSIHELQQNDWNSFDAFMVGSDQVWNTKYLYGNPAFLLTFTPEDKPKISFSSSFALKQLPKEYINLYKTELSKFCALSVREQNGVDIINQDLQINKNVKVTLDPTLLLDKEQWVSLSTSQNNYKKPYILLYLWTYAFEPRPYFERVVEYFQRKTGFEVRVLEGHRYLDDLKVSFIDNNRASIQEFIQLFAKAELVITSSFHGTAFAANFGKPLISIVPNGDSDDRQSTLLRNLELPNCIVRVGDDISQINPYYDKEKEQEKMSELRDDTLTWLGNTLATI